MTSRAVSTAARVASEMPGLPLRTRLTVASLTPACFATSARFRATLQLYDSVLQVLPCPDRPTHRAGDGRRSIRSTSARLSGRPIEAWPGDQEDRTSDHTPRPNVPAKRVCVFALYRRSLIGASGRPDPTWYHWLVPATAVNTPRSVATYVLAFTRIRSLTGASGRFPLRSCHVAPPSVDRSTYGA